MMSNKEVFLVYHNVWVNVSWENIADNQIEDKTLGLQKIRYKKGIPALMLISESKLFLLSEFKAQSKFMYVLPLSRKKWQSLYVELALEKLEKCFFGIFNNYIEFEPHGQVGRTRIDFKSVTDRQKREIKENLKKAKSLNKPALNEGIIVSGRPVEEVFMGRTGQVSIKEIIQALKEPMRIEPRVHNSRKI